MAPAKRAFIRVIARNHQRNLTISAAPIKIAGEKEMPRARGKTNAGAHDKPPVVRDAEPVQHRKHECPPARGKDIDQFNVRGSEMGIGSKCGCHFENRIPPARIKNGAPHVQGTTMDKHRARRRHAIHDRAIQLPQSNCRTLSVRQDNRLATLRLRRQPLRHLDRRLPEAPSGCRSDPRQQTCRASSCRCSQWRLPSRGRCPQRS